jgi:hypothetical protein
MNKNVDIIRLLEIGEVGALRAQLFRKYHGLSSFWMVLEAEETMVGRDPARRFCNILCPNKSVCN